jgi:putative transposase
MDVDPRGLRGWQLRRHVDQTLTWTALRRALAPHRPEMHHSDQGVPYAATAYPAIRRGSGVQSNMATVGEATENGYAERRRRTITEEEVTLHDDGDCQDAYQHLGDFLADIYHHKRLHCALGSLTPAEFETPWRPQRRATVPVQLDTP